MKAGKNRDELCYSFIYETSVLCDYEVVTDELCSLIGAAFSLLPPEFDDIAADLDRLQPLAFHLNGSIRGRMAVEEADITWLQGRLTRYYGEIGAFKGFILPRGDIPVPQLNQARSAAKKAIRLMVRVEEEGRAVPPELPRLANLMCNFLFALTQVINRRRGFEETPFISKSYSIRKRERKDV
jgi:ATP:cob(I)alamin adenosyltransferase